MLNKQNLVIAAFAAGHTDGVLVSDNFTAATDGRILAVVNRPKIEPDEFPSSPDGAPAYPKQGRFVIRTEDTKTLAKAIPPKPALPILENIMPLVPLPGDTRRFLLGNLCSMQVMTVNPTREKFPNIKKVWPKGKPKIEISFSVKLLENLLATMKKSSTKTFPIVIFSIYSPEDAVKFRCELTDEGQKMTGLIMPCKK